LGKEGILTHAVQNIYELRNDLGQTFGTKKAKKSIAARTENAITPLQSRANGGPSAKIDAASKAMLHTIGEATAGMSTSAQLADVVESNKPRPKANTEATEVQQVYTVDTLIGDQIMSLIPVRPWTEAMKAKKPVKVKSMYVAHRVVNVSENIEKLRILRYMYFVIRLLDTSLSKRGTKTLARNDDLREAIEDMPPSVLEHFKRKFTTNGTMTKFQIDMVMTHLCAMACLIDNFDVEIFDLQEDLHLETKVMAQYFLEIGAKILGLEVAQARKLDKAVAQSRRRAKLRLPLVFPKQKFSRAPKR
jgi:DNA-directed RNA polymerase I subunit RPA49